MKGPTGKPERPDWLDADAKTAWDEITPMLDAMGVLTRIDRKALARYRRLWSRWRKMEAFIEEKGEMYPLRDQDGKVKYFQQWPQVAIANKLAQQLTPLEREFGMTPSARTRLQLTPSHAQPGDGSKECFYQAG